MDVYLAGYADEVWRDQFVRQIDSDINVFDPMIQRYKDLDDEEYSNQIAKEIEVAETSEIVVFYLDENWNSYFSMLQLGDTVGRGQQVIVCIANEIKSEKKIRRYCDYRGVVIVESLDELIQTVEEMLAEVELCEVIE